MLLVLVQMLRTPQAGQNELTGTCNPAGVMFQWPGFLIAALVGAGAANFLKNPAPWVKGIVAGKLACLSCPGEPTQSQWRGCTVLA